MFQQGTAVQQGQQSGQHIAARHRMLCHQLGPLVALLAAVLLVLHTVDLVSALIANVTARDISHPWH
jgi:hypothetical protein